MPKVVWNWSKLNLWDLWIQELLPVWGSRLITEKFEWNVDLFAWRRHIWDALTDNFLSHYPHAHNQCYDVGFRFIILVCASSILWLIERFFSDLCFSSPCHNGGTCYRKERGVSCACPPDFTGAHCEIQTTLDTCQPNICSRGSTCFPRVRGGFVCQNCSARGDYVNSLCELTARSFYRGAYLTFPGLKNRHRLNIQLSFATQQRNGLLLYNGRYNERFDFIALEIVNSTLQFSFSLGSMNVTQVHTGKTVSDGLFHRLELSYFNSTATLTLDDCDVILFLEHSDEFPPQKSCAGRSSQVLERRCDMFTESCQRFLDLTGPLYIGGLPAPSSSFQIEAHSYLGCIKDVFLDHKFLDLNK